MLAIVSLAGALTAQAQDAARGKTLYESRVGPESRGCYQCHGFLSAGVPVSGAIARAANRPDVIQTAIDRNTGGMAYFKTLLTSTQLADIAAYVANPGGSSTPPPPAAAVFASPSALNFNAAVGTESDRQQFVIANNGNAYFTVLSIGIEGTAAEDFVLYALAGINGCAPNLVVQGGSACSLTYRFKPQAAGTRIATVTVAHTGPNSPVRLSLSGTATAAPQASMTLNANALTFASQAIGTSGAAQSVTIGNGGGAPLVLNTPRVEGTDPSDFGLGGSCIGTSNTVTVAAGSSCSLSVTFTPHGVGARSASVTLSSNASTPTAALRLSGTGAAAATPAAVLTPATLDFGDVAVGTTSAPRPVTLSNSGSAPLSMQSVTLSSGVYASTHNCGTTVPPGASCVIELRLTPAATATYPATLSVATNAADSPHRVTLSGRGVAANLPTLAWSGPTDGAFTGDVRVGSAAASKVFTLVNQGSVSATVSTVTIEGAAAPSEFPLAGTCKPNLVLAPAAACTVSVGFAPAQAGRRTAQLRIGVVSGNAPAPVALVGNGATTVGATLSWSLPVVQLPEVEVREASPEGHVVLVNQGTTTVTVREFRLSDPALRVRPGTGDACSALPMVLAPGAKCTLIITVDTGRVAKHKGELTLALGDGGSAAPLPIEASVEASGGCTLTRTGGATDPTLLLLACTAAVVLVRRQLHSSRGERR